MAVRGSVETGQAGFSLIETLVALVLLAIGVAAVTTGFTEGHRVADEVGRRQRAMALAQDKLAGKLARPYRIVTDPTEVTERVESGVLIGEDEVNGISRRWVVETDYPAPGLARVWVAARWMRRDSVQTFEIAGLVAEGLTR